MSEYDKVDEETFIAFRDALPRSATRCHIVRICEPPQMWFSNNNGLKMAFIVMMDGSSYYGGKTDEYYILSSSR